jgi:hypothetical protein
MQIFFCNQHNWKAWIVGYLDSKHPQSELISYILILYLNLIHASYITYMWANILQSVSISFRQVYLSLMIQLNCVNPINIMFVQCLSHILFKPFMSLQITCLSYSLWKGSLLSWTKLHSLSLKINMYSLTVNKVKQQCTLIFYCVDELILLIINYICNCASHTESTARELYFDSQQRQKMCRPEMGPSHLLSEYWRLFTAEQSNQIIKPTGHLQPVLGLRMSSALPLLHNMPSRYAQGQLVLYRAELFYFILWIDSDLYLDNVALNMPINMCNLCAYFFTLYFNFVITFFCSSVLQCHCWL